uniref:Lipoprotein LPP20-like domain-containing protein n=1 Tax=Hirondellea gigas TaxID=1518452 RepID=A0A6A7G247_9CRUS
MNIKKSILILTILTTAILSSCTAKESKPELGSNVDYKRMREYPKWVIQPTYDKGIAGIGSAKITDLGFDFARKEAMASARLDLGGQIKTKVDGLFKSYTSKIGVGDSTSVDSLAENIAKELVSIDIKGASLKDTWISPGDELFVLMTIDRERLVESTTKAINNSNNYTDENLKLKIKAESSQAELQRELNTYFGSFDNVELPEKQPVIKKEEN